jgi:HEAT repeat protein
MENLMKLPTIGRLILVTLVLTSHSSALPQENIPVPSSLAELKNPDSARRWAAYESIEKNEQTLKQADVRVALIDLLNLETQQIHNALVLSKGKQGAADKYGEGYVEYTAQLADTVIGIVDWRDPRELCILAETPYNAGSPFETKLVTEGGNALATCLLKIAQGSAYDKNDPFVVEQYDQVQTVPTLIRLASVTKDLTPGVRQKIRDLTLSVLRGDARLAAVIALGKFGAPDMIPVLEGIAQNDPQWRLLDNGQRRYDVREWASQAVRSIKERNHLNTP